MVLCLVPLALVKSEEFVLSVIPIGKKMMTVL